MHNFKRGTVLKLTCDVHEFLAKAPKAYEDLIDIIDEDGAVKVKTHNGDYVGFYGMKAKIHTRFMKQFVDVTPDKIEVPVIKLCHQDIDAINVNDWLHSSIGKDDGDDAVAWKTYDSCEVDENGERIILKKVTTNKEAAELDKQFETLNPNLAQERIEAKLALLGKVTDSLAMAASKLNSLGYEFKGDEWLNQEELKKQKITEMADKLHKMADYDIAQLLIDNNIEL